MRSHDTTLCNLTQRNTSRGYYHYHYYDDDNYYDYDEAIFDIIIIKAEVHESAHEDRKRALLCND